jgi:hypothetical protein
LPFENLIFHALVQLQRSSRQHSFLAIDNAENPIVADSMPAAQKAKRNHLPDIAHARLASPSYFTQGERACVPPVDVVFTSPSAGSRRPRKLRFHAN